MHKKINMNYPYDTRLLVAAYAMMKISTLGGDSLMTASGKEQQKTTTLS